MTIHLAGCVLCIFRYLCIFRLQKRIIRIMMRSRSRDSCRNLFISLKILPFPSLYIFFLLQFVIKYRELFTTNNEIHKFST